MARPIYIQKRLFVRGRSECMCCAHKFRWLMPAEVLPFWEVLCSSCSLAMPEEPPAKGEIVIEWAERGHIGE